MVFLKMPRWLRRMIRHRMHPMHEDKAWSFKQRASVVYVLLSGSAFLYVLYMCSTGRRHWPTYYGLRSPEEDKIRSSVQIANQLGIRQAQVVRISGLREISSMNANLVRDETGKIIETPLNCKCE